VGDFMDISDLYRLFEEGKYKEVIKFFSSSFPGTPEEYNLEALSFYNLGFVKESVIVLENGLIAFPRNKDLLFNLIEILYASKRYEEAQKYLREAIEIEPQNYVYYDIMATILFLESKNEKALHFAQKALKFAPSEVHDQLVDKYSQLEGTLSIRHENSVNAKKSKRMILVGSACNYPDSFRKFMEDGWELYVVRTQTWRAFQPNYELLENIGAKMIDREGIGGFLESMASKIDVVLRTGYFYGGNDLHRLNRICDVDQIDTFFKISSKVKGKNAKALSILAFDGDSFFSDVYWNDWLGKRIDVCDYILFDTKNLKDYFTNRISKVTSIDENKLKVLRVEMPLFEDVIIEPFEKYTKKVLTMGRSINSYLPVSNLFIEEMKEQISIGRGKSYREIQDGRSEFLLKYGDRAFGLGYFYDFYDRHKGFKELLKDGDDDNTPSNGIFYVHPSIYGYTNVPGKVITYLQFGIVPVIPNDENDFHRELIDNGMAIGVSKDTLFFDPNTYSDKTITEMRKNIGKHATIFTFDAFYNFVEALTEGRDVR
jgi:hypothetical protein